MVRAYADKLDGLRVEDVSFQSPSLNPCRAKNQIRRNIVWLPPLASFFKLNFDGSKLKDGTTSYGFVIRDDTRDIKLYGANSLSLHFSILVAEAWGLKEGVKSAISLGIKNLVIEGDTLVLYKPSKGFGKLFGLFNLLF